MCCASLQVLYILNGLSPNFWQPVAAFLMKTGGAECGIGDGLIGLEGIDSCFDQGSTWLLTSFSVSRSSGNLIRSRPLCGDIHVKPANSLIYSCSGAAFLDIDSTPIARNICRESSWFHQDALF